VGVLLLDPVVAVQVEALAVLAGLGGVRRLRPEAAEVGREMPVVDHQRIARVGVALIALRQEDVGSESDRPAPKPAEPLGGDGEVLDVFGVRGLRDRRDLLVQGQRDRSPLGGIQLHPARRAVEVARLAAPLLPFPPVRRQLDGVAVGAVEGLVAVEQRLDPVAALRQAREVPNRIPEHP